MQRSACADFYVYLIYDRMAEFVILRLRKFVFAIRRCAVIYIWRAADHCYRIMNFIWHIISPRIVQSPNAIRTWRR